MSQQIAMDCDTCRKGDIGNDRAAPWVIYLVAGPTPMAQARSQEELAIARASGDKAAMEAAQLPDPLSREVMLPKIVRDLLTSQTGRIEFCVGCFASQFKLKSEPGPGTKAELARDAELARAKALLEAEAAKKGK